MQPEQQQRIMGYFIEEAKDHLNTIEQGLLNLQSTIEDQEMVNEVFRAAHSVKGGAAMLGINSIQKVSHRLEDSFKLLKECPVRVDQRLESLFLRVFDALHELLEQLQGPFGLTEDTSASIMSGIEPIFTELNNHLGALITQAGGVITAEGEIALAPAAAASVVASQPAPVHQEQSALLLVFQSDVPNQLRAMLHCFKQAESPESRQQLQDLCSSLQRMGEQFDLSSWCDVLETSRQAIASTDNTYRALAPIVIKEIKQAQELVLANRADEITPSEQLRALAPVAVEPAEFDLADLLAVDDSLELVTADETSLTEAFDLFEDEASEVTLPSQEGAIAPSEDYALEDLFGTSEATVHTSDAHSMTGVDFTAAEGQAHPISDARTGPEVGMAELNSLADLFEGEALDLGMSWQEQEIAREAAPHPEASLDDFSPSEDFSDLLFDETDTSVASDNNASSDDDLTSLFGSDDLLDDESFGFSDLNTPSVVVPADLDAALDSSELLDVFDLDAQALEDDAALSSSEPPDELSAFAAYDEPASGAAAPDDLSDLFGSLDESDLTAEVGEASSTTNAEDFPNFFAADDLAANDFAETSEDSLTDSLLAFDLEPEAASVSAADIPLEEIDFSAEFSVAEEATASAETDWLTEIAPPETDDVAASQAEDFRIDESSDLDAMGLFGEETPDEPMADLFGDETEDLNNLFDFAEEPLNLELEPTASTPEESEFSLDLETEPTVAAPETAIADPWGNTAEETPNWLDSAPSDLDLDLSADLTENDFALPTSDTTALDDAELDLFAETAEPPADVNDFMTPALTEEELDLEFGTTEEPQALAESMTLADDADLSGDLWENGTELLDFNAEADTSAAIADFSEALDLEAASDADWLTDDLALDASDAGDAFAEIDTDLWSEASVESLETSEPAIAEDADLDLGADEFLFEDTQEPNLTLGGEALLFEETETSDLGLGTEDFIFEDTSDTTNLGLEDWPATAPEAPSEGDLGLDLGSDLGGDLWEETMPAIADLAEPSTSEAELDFGEQGLESEPTDAFGEDLFGREPGPELNTEEVVDLGADLALEATAEPTTNDGFDLFSSEPSAVEAVDTFEELAFTDNTDEDAEPFDLFAEEPSTESALFDGLELEAPELTAAEPITSPEDLNLVELDEFSDLTSTEPSEVSTDEDLFGTAIDFESELGLELSDVAEPVTPEGSVEAIADLDFDLGGLDEVEASPFTLETEAVDEAPLDDLFGESEPSLEADDLFGESEPSLEVDALDLGNDDLAFDDLLTETSADNSTTDTANDWLEDFGEASEPVGEASLETSEVDDLDFGDFAIAETPALETEDSAEDLFAPEAETTETSDFGSELGFDDLDLNDLGVDSIAATPEAEGDLDLDFDAIAIADAEPTDTDAAFEDLEFGDLDFTNTEAAMGEEVAVESEPSADFDDLSNFLEAESTDNADFGLEFDQDATTSESADSGLDDFFGLETGSTSETTDVTEARGGSEALELGGNDDLDLFALESDAESLNVESNDLDLFSTEATSASTEDTFDFFGTDAAEASTTDTDELDFFGTDATEASTTDTDELDFFSLEAVEEAPGDLGFSGIETDLAVDDRSFADLDSLLSDEAITEEISPEPTFAAEPDLDSDLDFDDLEALLGDEDLAESGSSADSAEFSDFSDLEALLGDEDLSGAAPDLATASINNPVSFSQSETATTKAEDLGDSEFDDLEKLLEDADQKLGGPPTVKTNRGLAQQATRLQNRRPGAGFGEQTMRVPVKHLDNLSNLVGELVVNRNSLEQDQERLRQFLDNLLYQVQQLSDVGQRMRDLYERSLLESSLLANRHSHHASHSGGLAQSHSTGADFDALEMDRFTAFHTLSQEMIELIVRVRESSSDIEFIVDETDQVTRMFRQVTTQLQEGLTRSRMVPFAQIADRLPRAVRDISLKCGKQAELHVEGRETLIDKMILEQLYDPMTHLVNNAIAHGIETPDVRQAAGKPPTGRITIRAFHQGNQTVISVSDDGAGIDPERVRAKAVEKGLLTQAESYTLSRLDIYDLLFHPGFTTKDEVTDYAGRGVGMDVVRTSLSEIRGAITTDSAVGKGTTFTIRLPLTLSISKALCCISNRARIAFPMDGVEDMLDVPKERVQTNAEGEPCILWRDLLLPFRPLADILKYNRYLGRGSVYGGNQEDDIISIVVLRSAGNFIALQVDQVLGEQEIVIKQLEGPVPKPIGVAGATVLGDGRIMPIADVLELIDLSMGRIRRDASTTLWDQTGDQVPAEPVVAKTEPTVLIVDDSITVRELLSMTFNKVGYRVEQARDGQEAWEKLRSGLPCDMVFCDIEMPRMDGLELLSRIQKDPSLNHLPIAMLTSRGADRHRQMAAQLGAKGYFTKPYLEEGLLDAAQRMLKGEVLITASTSSNA